MKKTFLVLPLALLVSGAVNAATDNPFYAGARLGNSFYDIKDSTNNIDLDNKTFQAVFLLVTRSHHGSLVKLVTLT